MTERKMVGDKEPGESGGAGDEGTGVLGSVEETGEEFLLSHPAAHLGCEEPHEPFLICC